MATAIIFNGRRINRPGAYSKYDTSALSSTAPSPIGVLAILGTAEGGKPLTVDSEFSDATRAETIRSRYRSGNLFNAGIFAFQPANDEAIPQGASRIVAVKVNPATQSAATLADAVAAASVVVTSKDYGLFTTQINISVAAGTSLGKKITIKFEDTIEILDNVGGAEIFDVLYTPGANGYGTMTGRFTSTQFLAAATKALTGLVGERTAEMNGTGIATVLSSDAGDIGTLVTVYGLVGTTPAKDIITLNGTTPVAGTVVFTSVSGSKKSAATVGTVTVRSSVPTTLFTLAPGTLTRGLSITTNMPAGGVITVSVDANAAGEYAIYRGLRSGAEVAERFPLDTAFTSPVVGVQIFDSITQIELGDVTGARTVTATLNAVAASLVSYSTIKKLTDFLSALSGITTTTTVTNPTTFATTAMDYASAVTLMGAAGNFFAENFAFIDAINTTSDLVTAARATPGNLGPTNTAVAAYLSGGIEGVVTSAQWQAALDLLKKRRVTQIVVCTEDPAVHALLLDHLKLRAGVVKSEASGWVGLGTAGGAGETKTNVKAQIRALNTRHIAAVSHEMKRTDPVSGTATWYPPWMYAVVHAGMQAGAPVGEPLTKKTPRVLDVRNDASWSVENDNEEMIDAGLCMTEMIEGIPSIVRSVTTHLADDNPVYVEVSGNAAADFATYEFRRRMDKKIGTKGLSRTVGQIKALAYTVLGEMVRDEIIVAFQNITVEQIGDVFPVGAEISPVLPVNFIPVTMHLTVFRAVAA